MCGRISGKKKVLNSKCKKNDNFFVLYILFRSSFDRNKEYYAEGSA